jgi:diaminobutyrate-2-oxoglutarate transaminase
VQAEGGVNVAPIEWLQELSAICAEYEILLVIDDIQTGCGRTGPFFSFERAGIVPDVVTLSKSISGYGLPMALTLMRPELDLWTPGEHTGTFRGNQLAFITGAAALELFEDEAIPERVAAGGATIETVLREVVLEMDRRLEIRGVGMIWGIDTGAIDLSGVLARDIGRHCFENGLIIERTGREDTVIKILPPLTIDAATLRLGLEILCAGIEACPDRGR